MQNDKNQPKNNKISNYTYGLFAGLTMSVTGLKVLQETSADKRRSLKHFQTEHHSYQDVLRKSPLPEYELRSLYETLTKEHNAEMTRLTRNYARSNQTGLGLLFTGAATTAYCTYKNINRLIDSSNEHTAKASPRPSK